MKGESRNFYFYLLVSLLIIFSFFQFSYRFTPLLNSDIAINILMTPGYSLPSDLYAWGQDRGGTLIPMLSHIVYKVIHISPISAVSIVHYMILILGFLCALPLFKSRISRFFLLLIWFFPSWHFVDFVLFPFGTQVSLMFIGIFFLGKQKVSKSLFIQTLWLSLSSLLFITSIWVSDLGLIPVLLLFPFVFYEWVIKAKEDKEWKWLILNCAILILWTVIGMLFIMYAKQHATRIDVYSDQPFNSGKEIMSSLKIIAGSLFKTFGFMTENPVEGIYAWMIIAGISVIKWFSIFRNKGWFSKTDKKWFLFFAISGMVLFIVMLLSHWVYMNGVGRRYFVLVYLFFAMVILLMAETTDGKIRRSLNIILSVILITGFISSFYKFYIPKHRLPAVKILSEFQSLGDIGLIAEYWNAYQSATPDPVRIKATPHDKDYVRNFKLVDEVFAQPKLYIIKDMWLDSFPDTLRQFGRTLAKKGDQFYIGGCWVNQYEIALPHHDFFFRDLKYQGKAISDTKSDHNESLMIGPSISYDKNLHFIYGPFLKLIPGKYILRYWLRVENNSNTSPLAQLDVSAGFGKEVLVSKEIKATDFPKTDAFIPIELNFETKKQHEGIEFRIFYLGNADLYFEKVVLIEFDHNQ